jgi:hypothetical protein
MPKRDQAVLGSLVIGLLIGAAATYEGANLGRTMTTTVTKTTTTTITLASSSSTCAQLEPAPLFLLIANSSTGSRISGIPVQVEKTTPIRLCRPNSTISTNLGTMETNVNGSIEVCCTGSTFSFTFAYMGANYQLSSTAESAAIAQCVWFYVPSATSTIVFAAPIDPQC